MHWLGNSSHLLVNTIFATHYELYDLDTSTLTITPLTGFPATAETFDVTPDGRTFTFLGDTPTSAPDPYVWRDNHSELLANTNRKSRTGTSAPSARSPGRTPRTTAPSTVWSSSRRTIDKARSTRPSPTSTEARKKPGPSGSTATGTTTQPCSRRTAMSCSSPTPAALKVKVRRSQKPTTRTGARATSPTSCPESTTSSRKASVIPAASPSAAGASAAS